MESSLNLLQRRESALINQPRAPLAVARSHREWWMIISIRHHKSDQVSTMFREISEVQRPNIHLLEGTIKSFNLWLRDLDNTMLEMTWQRRGQDLPIWRARKDSKTNRPRCLVPETTTRMSILGRMQKQFQLVVNQNCLIKMTSLDLGSMTPYLRQSNRMWGQSTLELAKDKMRVLYLETSMFLGLALIKTPINH